MLKNGENMTNEYRLLLMLKLIVKQVDNELIKARKLIEEIESHKKESDCERVKREGRY